MQAIWDFFKNDRFAQHGGLELPEIEAGRTKARMTITDAHLNGVDLAHGGAIFVLADLGFAAAANSYGTVAVAINASIWFVKAARQGTRYAEGVATWRHPKLPTYWIKVADEASETIALFEGMVPRKKDQIDPPAP